MASVYHTDGYIALASRKSCTPFLAAFETKLTLLYVRVNIRLQMSLTPVGLGARKLNI